MTGRPGASRAVSVLIVEDVDTMREMLAQLVGGIPGFKVSGTARNVPEARFELTRRRPDLVLLDEILPGESSLDLLAEIRSVELPVLLLTGVQDPRHALPEGAAGRLVKPSWAELREAGPRFGAAMRSVLEI